METDPFANAAPADASAFLQAFGKLPTTPTSHIALTIFDDYPFTAGTSFTFYSTAALNNLLGLFDQIAIQLFTDTVVGTSPTISCAIEHSAGTGIWAPKSATLPEIPVLPLSTTDTTTLVGYDDGGVPSLAFVRLAFTLAAGAAGVSAHVRCVVACNDSRERTFSQEMWDSYNAYGEGTLRSVGGHR